MKIISFQLIHDGLYCTVLHAPTSLHVFKLLPTFVHGNCYTSSMTLLFSNSVGSNCKEFYQEAAAYGPSIDRAIKIPTPELGFDPSICMQEYLSDLECPEDPEIPPIISEFQPPPLMTTVSVDKAFVTCGDMFHTRHLME